MARRQDAELQQYRDLLKVPEQFEDGFSSKMIMGALLLGFLMVPGSIYLSLFMGQGLGPAAQWVTVILFAEVAKRSMKGLRQQEIYLIFYMTGIAVSGQLHGGILSQLLWNQYLVQSPAAIGMGVASEIPHWVAPPRELLETTTRTFFNRAWMPPIAFITGTMLLSRIDHFGLGYALYKITAHHEKLPFPMAPQSALAITAMADDKSNPTERWRWRYFAIGAVLGLGFGLVYVGVPTLTATLFGRAVKVIPVPWLDFTAALSTREFLPAVPLNLVFDMGFLILGMVLPFWAVVGGFFGLIATMVLNPLLYHAGILTSWRPGMGVVDTMYSNTVDFYLSFGIGLALAIFGASILPVMYRLLKPFIVRKLRGDPGDNKERDDAPKEKKKSFWALLTETSSNRGDISIFSALMIYAVSTVAYIAVCVWLMPGDPATGIGRFPWVFFFGFAFIYQPIVSYTSAKLEATVGQTVQIPLVRQAAYILSGYQGAAIWFAPVPMNDFGTTVRGFRVLELTGTKLTSVIKTEFMVVPILLVCSLLFCELIWRMAPIPSEFYPFTQEVWHLNALNFSLTASSTMEGSSPFMEALKFDVIGYGFGAGLLSFAVLSYLGLPTLLVYGAVRGLNQTSPGGLILEMTGALVGRYYLQKKLGFDNYKKYVMVIFAGFGAGVGLIGMAAVAIALIIKSTTTVGY